LPLHQPLEGVSQLHGLALCPWAHVMVLEQGRMHQASAHKEGEFEWVGEQGRPWPLLHCKEAPSVAQRMWRLGLKHRLGDAEMNCKAGCRALKDNPGWQMRLPTGDGISVGAPSFVGEEWGVVSLGGRRGRFQELAGESKISPSLPTPLSRSSCSGGTASYCSPSGVRCMR